MPSAFRDPKTLPSWFDLHYFRWPRRLVRWRTALVWSTLFLSLIVVASLVAVPGATRAFQAGPVSEAHAMFNNDCARCHDQSFQTPRRFLTWNRGISAVSDDACQKCHAGPAHNPLQSHSPRCASCHREHRGREALARVEDSHCTACHAHIATHRQSSGTPGFPDVSGFPDAHPEFTVRSDPGTLHFNHAVHLKSEGVLVDPVTNKTRVVGCADCHQADATGRYMQPVVYDKHCAQCHPLSVQLTGIKDARLAGAVKEFNARPAPHREAEVVRAVLRERLLGFVQANPVVLDKDLEPERGVPRSRPLGAAVGLDEWVWAQTKLSAQEQLTFVTRQHDATQAQLRAAGACVFCHTEERPAEPTADGLFSLPEHRPTRLFDRWMPHSRFSHKAHQMLNCTECHPANNSTRSSDTLMPAKANCAQCHSPRVGVRHDCVACHDYHAHKSPLDQSRAMSIERCLGK